MKNITKKPAFSLMEVMVILLILTVTLAATAPMISKKMSRNVGTAEEPWKFTGTDSNILFRESENTNSTVFIGTDRLGPQNNASIYPFDGVCMNIRMNDNHKRVDADGGVPAISFTASNINDNNHPDGSLDPRILSHLGMTTDDGCPFFSNRIPRGTGILWGNRLGSEVINGKAILGYDCGFSRAADDNNNPTHFRELRNIILLGSDISPNAWQNVVSIGRGIQTSAGRHNGNPNRRPMSNSVILNTSYPISIVPQLVAAQVVDGVLVPEHLDPNGALAQAFYNTVWTNNAFNSGNRADPYHNNATELQGETLIGGTNMAVGSYHTIIGRESFCGRIYHAVGVPGMSERNSYSSVAVGNGANADGNNCVAIGNNTFAGVQQIQDARGVFGGTTDPLNNTVAIGSTVTAQAPNAVAIGMNVTSGIRLGGISANSGIVIGFNATCQNSGIAIGSGVQATGNSSIAIGASTSARHINSVAIGNGAVTTDANQIVLGTRRHTVVIPGNVDSKTANKIVIAAGLDPSDIRLKNVGEKFTSGIEEIKKLEFFNYTFKNDKEQKPHVGVMAQDLQKVFPISVTEGADGYLRIRKDEMFYAALNAIKELNQKIIALAGEVKEFFARVDKLDLRVAKHQASLDELKSEFAEIDARLAKLEEE